MRVVVYLCVAAAACEGAVGVRSVWAARGAESARVWASQLLGCTREAESTALARARLCVDVAQARLPMGGGPPRACGPGDAARLTPRRAAL